MVVNQCLRLTSAILGAQKSSQSRKIDYLDLSITTPGSLLPNSAETKPFEIEAFSFSYHNWSVLLNTAVGGIVITQVTANQQNAVSLANFQKRNRPQS